MSRAKNYSTARAINGYCDLQRPKKADIFDKCGARSLTYFNSVLPHSYYQLTKRRPVPCAKFLQIGKIPFLSKVMAVLNLRILNNVAKKPLPKYLSYQKLWPF